VISTNTRWQLIAVVASLLAVGGPYWPIPYQRLNLPDALLTPALLVVAVSAMLLRSRRMASFWRATWAVGASVPLAVAMRVLVDVMHDGTSHNLWPIEIFIAWLIGLACALLGAIAGSAVAAALGVARHDANP
jgi:hypothetical protein